MQITPINNSQTNFKSKFIPTNTLRLTLIEGQRTSNKTLLKTMKNLLNDGVDRTIELNALLRSRLGEKEFYKLDVKISDLGAYSKSYQTNDSIEKTIVKEVRKALKLFFGDLSEEYGVDTISKKEISNELKKIEQDIFKEEIYKY